MKILCLNRNILNKEFGGRDNQKSNVAAFPLWSFQKGAIG